MRTWITCLAPLLLLVALSADTLRVATYNVNNYLIMDRMVDGSWRPAYPKPESEKAIVREVITVASPDILVLQEIGSSEFLEELRIDLKQAGLHYPYAVHMQGVDTERHLAVLSKQSPVEVVKHDDLDFKYFDGREMVKRGMLELRFNLGQGQFFQLFAVHLKSRFAENKADAESAMRRAREAEACRDRLIERTIEKGQINYLVLGDFNEHPVSAPLRRFYQRGDLEIGTWVPAFDSRGESWTYHYAREYRYEAVDGVVASPAMRAFIKNGHAQIVDIPSALSGSDHRLVFLDLLTDSNL
jgi:endonuclease/exonuclease/phosphatase family metal-dependent hydrolase